MAKQISNRWQQTLASVVLLLLVTSAGCEDVPRLKIDGDTSQLDEGVVTTSGRGGYDWFMVNGQFDVTPPYHLPVLAEIDRELIKKNLIPLKYEPPVAPHRPEGLTDEVYHAYSQLLEPHFDTAPILTIPFESKFENGFCVNTIGDRLVKLSDQLETWDLTQSKLLWQVPLPSANCRGLVLAGEADALVWDSKSVYRVALATGEVISNWNAPQGESLVQLVGATQVERFAVRTESKKLYALDENLQFMYEYSGPPLTETKISIRPDGEWVIGLTKGMLVRWHITPEGDRVETPDGTIEKNVELLAGKYVDYAMQPFESQFFYFDDSNDIPSVSTTELCVRMHAACLGTQNGKQEWLTVCNSRVAEDGARNYFLQDIFFRNGRYSESFPLGQEPILELRANRQTDVVAVRDAKQLRVYRRQYWKDSSLYWPMSALAGLPLDGEFEQIELVAADLLKRGRLKHGTGQSYYSVLVRYIASDWSQLEKLEKTEISEEGKAALQRLETWLNSDSNLALLASARRDLNIGYDARGTGMSSTVTQQGWQIYESRNLQAKRAISKVLSRKDPTACALVLAISTEQNLGESIDQLQPLIKQYIELHPNGVLGHSDICLHLLPRWGGSAGDGGAYIAAVAGLLPSPNSDLLYLRACQEMIETFGDGITNTSESGLSVGRLLQSVSRLIESDDLSQEEVLFLLTMATEYNQVDAAKRLAALYVRNFDVLSLNARPHIATLIRNARQEMDKE